MSKVKVLVFAADPYSAPPDGASPRLLLDEDVRLMREKVRAAEHRDAVVFDVRWAARTDDLLQALNETRPQVVHFSGHGGSEGLVLVSADGRGSHCVDATALAQVFQLFRADIRVVVLNACFSFPQAEAIAEAVGCAIGTLSEISDQAAITFGASFYRAIAFGQSVQVAYDQARAALALERFEDQECPRLVARPGVDPDTLVLVAPEGNVDAGAGTDTGSRGMGRVGTTIAALALAGAAVAAGMRLGDRDPGSPGVQTPDSVPTAASRASADTFPAPDSAPAPARPAEPVAGRSGGGGRRPVVETRPDNVEERVLAPSQGTVGASGVRQGLDTSFAVISDTAPNRTMRPPFPR